MPDVQRRINLTVAVVHHVGVFGLIYLIAFTLLTGKPWWLVLGLALLLPDLALGALAGYRDMRGAEQVVSAGGRRATRILTAAGVILMVGMASSTSSQH